VIRVEPVAPGVARAPVPTPTLPPATTTNAWLLGDDEIVVVDPGSPWPEAQADLAGALTGKHVSAIFLTHAHADHMGGVQDLRRRTGAALWAHPRAAADAGLRADRLVHDNDTVLIDGVPWQALLTEGHAPGHLCLWDATARVLVAGDLVAGEGTILLAPPEGHLGTYLDSLRRARALQPALVLPAHGPALGPEVLDQYLAHRARRTDAARAALAAHGGPVRPADLVPAVYGPLPDEIAVIAALQLQVHLDALVEAGEAAAAPGGAYRAARR
jgi:glyoxylase-like metal-dependent hydrolase (beta-lactamase superfamily II)